MLSMRCDGQQSCGNDGIKLECKDGIAECLLSCGGTTSCNKLNFDCPATSPCRVEATGDSLGGYPVVTTSTAATNSQAIMLTVVGTSHGVDSSTDVQYPGWLNCSGWACAGDTASCQEMPDACSATTCNANTSSSSTGVVTFASAALSGGDGKLDEDATRGFQGLSVTHVGGLCILGGLGRLEHGTEAASVALGTIPNELSFCKPACTQVTEQPDDTTVPSSDVAVPH